MITVGISSWSIHRALDSQAVDLLDVPGLVRSHGMTDLQICHFHVKSRDDASLAALRERIEANGVTLDALLIDFGDISHPTKSADDLAAMTDWLEVAGKLGARHARISAGHGEPTEENLRRAAANLLQLAELGDSFGVEVITENWHAMVPNARTALRLRELTHGRVGLCLDFGNWSGSGKCYELAAIAPHAVTVHAKCAFAAADTPDAEDFTRCLQILKASNFAGTIALIYDGPSADEWRHLDQELTLLRNTFPN